MVEGSNHSCGGFWCWCWDSNLRSSFQPSCYFLVTETNRMKRNRLLTEFFFFGKIYFRLGYLAVSIISVTKTRDHCLNFRGTIFGWFLGLVPCRYLGLCLAQFTKVSIVWFVLNMNKKFHNKSGCNVTRYCSKQKNYMAERNDIFIVDLKWLI